MDDIAVVDQPDDVAAAKNKADYDAVQLANITGYEQQMVRRWSLQKVIGMGLGLASTWAFAGAGLTLVIAEGGPAAALYGFILVSIFTFCVAVSIAELISAFPTTGGPFYWTARLASPKYASFLSMLTGAANCMSWICACASVASTNAQQIFGFVVIMQPEFHIQRWMLYILYLFFMIAGMLFTMFLYPLVPIVNKYLIYWSQTAMMISIIMMLARSSGNFASSHFVWAEYINNTGWDNVLCFITGLINGGFQYGHLDASVHLAEEASRPERNIPIAIGAQMAVSFPQGFLFQIVMFYCIKDLPTIMSSTIPNAELYLQAMNYSKAGAVVLQLLTVSILICVNLEVQTTAARLVWSFARDKALPFSNWLSVVHPKLLVPVNAQIVVNCIVFVLGFLYLFAAEAYSALVGSSFILAYLAYLIPITSLVLTGRKFKPGPFHMKGYGFIVNILSMGWLLVGIVFWQFPFFMPVVGNLGNMNWTVVVVGGIMLLAALWFAFKGHKHFQVSVGLRDIEPVLGEEPRENPVAQTLPDLPEQSTEKTKSTA
jgi:choline transport protein